MKLARYSIKHPVVIGMILIVLVVFGVFSITTMNVSFMSDISMSNIMVVSVYPGAGAEDVEQEVTNILEEDFVTLPGFKSINSVSQNSVSQITINFQDTIDPYEQLPEVRNRISQKMEDLPDQLLGTPDAIVGGMEMIPIFTFTVTGGDDRVMLTDYIKDTLRPQITAIPGVSVVSISGQKELQLNIELRSDDLIAKGVSVAQIYQILNYANVTIPIGKSEFETKTIDVSFDGSFSSIKDINNLPVGKNDDNVIIRLSDVANVSLSPIEEEVLVSDGENNIIVVSVQKRSDGNVLDITDEIKSIFESEEALSGGAIQFDIVSDDSRVVRASVGTAIQSGILGIIMAIFVFLLFLSDARATIIIALSIPLSLLFTFIGMNIFGVNINIMPLSGMIVALGMVVDGSIVMIEQVYRYYTKRTPEGTLVYTINESIEKGASEVTGSIIAGALTTIVVFLPIAVLSGLIGMILNEVALTLVFALIASLFVSIVVVPFLLKQLLRKEPKVKPVSKFNKGVAYIEAWYKKLLQKILVNRKYVLFLAVGLLIISGLLIPAIGVAFIPSVDNGDFSAAVKFPIGYDLERTQSQMIRAQKLIEQNIEGVKTTVVYTGVEDDITFGGVGSPNTGLIKIVLVPESEREKRVQELILEVQNMLTAAIPDAKVTVQNGGFDRLLSLVTGGMGYAITLVSEDMETLYAEASRLSDFLKEDPEVVTVNLDTNYDNTTYIIDMSHEYMSSLGVSSYEAGITANILFEGTDIGTYFDNTTDTRYNMRLYSDITDKPITHDTLAQISVQTLNGDNVSFAVLADTITEQSLSAINHTNREKTITISTTLVSESTSGVAKRMEAYLEKNPLPYEVRTQSGGIMELIEDSIPPILTALFAACFLVFTVMTIQFERFKQPLLIMGTIPFSIIGVILSLLCFGSTLNLLSVFGVISLSGIVVNNGIILIDYINLLRDERSKLKQETLESLKRSIIEGASSRIRPILMTTLTTMLGVIPMCFAQGEGAEIYAPLGQAIAGGLFSSTLITLVIIPALYYISESKRLLKQEKKELINE